MQRGDTNFYDAFLALPPDRREAIVAVWNFCRAVDDEADEPDGSGAPAGQGMAAWRVEIGALYGEGSPRTPQGRTLAPWVGRFGLPRESFEAVMDGVEGDLWQSRYATFPELREYCLKVASAVGLICLPIFGCREPGARRFAIELGVALQLTNIIRDVSDDLARGRIYLPGEDMDRFGVTEAMLQARRMRPEIRALLSFECERARSHYAAAGAALPPGERKPLVAARIMGATYFAILRGIERRGCDVFAGRYALPRWRKALVALRVRMLTALGR